MASDERSAASLLASLWGRLVGGLRWAYVVCRGFSSSRHLDQPEN